MSLSSEAAPATSLARLSAVAKHTCAACGELQCVDELIRTLSSGVADMTSATVAVCDGEGEKLGCPLACGETHTAPIPDPTAATTEVASFPSEALWSRWLASPEAGNLQYSNKVSAAFDAFERDVCGALIHRLAPPLQRTQSKIASLAAALELRLAKLRWHRERRERHSRWNLECLSDLHQLAHVPLSLEVDRSACPAVWSEVEEGFHALLHLYAPLSPGSAQANHDREAGREGLQRQRLLRLYEDMMKSLMNWRE